MWHSLPLIPEEREPREGVVSEDLCVLGQGIDHEGGALVGDPKVNLFYLNIRSLAVATTHRQGAHPWIVYYNFFDKYAMDTKMFSTGFSRSQGHILLFCNTEREGVSLVWEL